MKRRLFRYFTGKKNTHTLLKNEVWTFYHLFIYFAYVLKIYQQASDITEQNALINHGQKSIIPCKFIQLVNFKPVSVCSYFKIINRFVYMSVLISLL